MKHTKSDAIDIITVSQIILKGSFAPYNVYIENNKMKWHYDIDEIIKKIPDTIFIEHFPMVVEYINKKREPDKTKKEFDWCAYLDEEWWCKEYLKVNPAFGKTSLDIKILPFEGKITVKEAGPLSMQITIKNNSSENVSMTLAHEWHGGEWPPTDFYGFVSGNDGEWRGLPVCLLGEDPNAQQPVTLKPKGKIEINVRLDWHGTGSVKAKPLIGDFVITSEREEKHKVLEGKYKMRFVLVFKVKKNTQYIVSKEVELELVK